MLLDFGAHSERKVRDAGIVHLVACLESDTQIVSHSWMITSGLSFNKVFILVH